MPTTQTYGWPYFAEGIDPWYDEYVDTVHAIESTVSSVELISRARVTQVVSMYPTGDLVVSSATGVDQGADGRWTVLSAAPFGRCVGSFQLVGSGAQALVTFAASPYARDNASGTIGSGGRLYVRAVAQRTGATSLVIPSNSGWVQLLSATNLATPFTVMHAASLGPGTYSIEFQARFAMTSGTSLAYFPGSGQSCIQATVLEVSRGG